jgi:hypothetical protein
VAEDTRRVVTGVFGFLKKLSKVGLLLLSSSCRYPEFKLKIVETLTGKEGSLKPVYIIAQFLL